jgi:hypothetical protein
MASDLFQSHCEHVTHTHTHTRTHTQATNWLVPARMAECAFVSAQPSEHVTHTQKLQTGLFQRARMTECAFVSAQSMMMAGTPPAKGVQMKRSIVAVLVSVVNTAVCFLV